MLCKYCNKNVKEDFKKIGLGCVHNECFDDYIKSIYAKVKIRRKPKRKILTPQQEKEKLRKKCVFLAKAIAKERDGAKCRYCGVGEPQRRMNLHHIIHEGLSKEMSADIDNLITLCVAHHQGGTFMKSNDKFNFHNSPVESTEWLKANLPNYDDLIKRSKKTKVIDMEFWKEKLNDLNIKRNI